MGGISEKFVPEPTGEDILSDVINRLHRLKDPARWNVFHKQLLVQEEKDRENHNNQDIACNSKKKKSNNNHTNMG